MKYTKAEKADALESLRGLLKPGATVYTVLRSKSRSGGKPSGRGAGYALRQEWI